MIKCTSLLYSTSILLLLTGCGTVYKTVYTYKQPKQHTGRQCIRQCLVNRTQCSNTCIRQYNRCKQQENTLRLLKSELRRHRHTTPDLPDISNACTQQCGCVQAYNTCYTSCGGTVIPHQKCIAFCHHQHG